MAGWTAAFFATSGDLASSFLIVCIYGAVPSSSLAAWSDAIFGLRGSREDKLLLKNIECH